MAQDPVKLARQLRSQHEALQEVVSSLEATGERHPQAPGAASALVTEACEQYDRGTLYDLYGWVRDAKQVRKLIELECKRGALARTLERTEGQTRDLHEVEQQYGALSEELGVNEPMGSPGFEAMQRIAEAVEDGAGVDPSSAPDGWPAGKSWLRVPKVWDPDKYLTTVIERHLRQPDVMLTASPEALLRLAWSIRLAASKDRTLTESVLRAGNIEDIEVAGDTLKLLEIFDPEGASPVRCFLANRGGWSAEFDDAETRERFRLRSDCGDGGMPEANDLAESLTAIEYANLDAHLLAVGRELVEVLSIAASGESKVAPPTVLGGADEDADDSENAPSSAEAVLRERLSGDWRVDRVLGVLGKLNEHPDEWIPMVVVESLGLPRSTVQRHWESNPDGESHKGSVGKGPIQFKKEWLHSFVLHNWTPRVNSR